MLDACHLAKRYAVPLTAAEVHSDVCGAYRADATTRFPVYEYALELDITNLLCLSHPTASCFLPRCYSLGNRKGQLSDPCLSLTN